MLRSRELGSFQVFNVNSASVVRFFPKFVFKIIQVYETTLANCERSILSKILEWTILICSNTLPFSSSLPFFIYFPLFLTLSPLSLLPYVNLSLTPSLSLPFPLSLFLLPSVLLLFFLSLYLPLPLHPLDWSGKRGVSPMWPSTQKIKAH